MRRERAAAAWAGLIFVTSGNVAILTLHCNKPKELPERRRLIGVPSEAA
jgi:hypothetical protein